MLKMPIRCSDFKELIDGNYCFVDKSRFIDIIIRTGTHITFIPRPHLFGKTLFLSMLDAYLNLRYADDPDRFKGMRISEMRPDDPEKNAHVVINLSLKDLGDGTYAMFRRRITERIRQTYANFPELLSSSKLHDFQKKMLDEVYNSDKFCITHSLRYLCEMLDRHYGMNPILLIDDYDSILIDSCMMPHEHERIVKDLRPFLSITFDGNHHLRSAVVTGAMGIPPNEFFPDLDIMIEHGISNTRYGSVCGFTHGEVEEMLKIVGHPEKIDEVDEWYGGYRFGDSYIYNPWDVIKYVDKGFRPEPYWTRTLDNMPITNLLFLNDDNTWISLARLLTDRSVNVREVRYVPYRFPLFERHEIYRMMAVAGYLGAEPNEETWRNGYELYIPNRELFDNISDKVIERFGTVEECITSCIDKLESGETKDLVYWLKSGMSCLSGKIQMAELPCEAFAVGLIALARGRYEICIEKGVQEGRSDIFMTPVSEKGVNILIEVDHSRRRNSDLSMKKLAKSALEGIRKRIPEYEFKRKTLLYGIAFEGREPTIVMEKIGS